MPKSLQLKTLDIVPENCNYMQSCCNILQQRDIQISVLFEPCPVTLRLITE